MKADRKTVETIVKTARGQLDAVLKMVADDRYCMDIVAQLQAAQSLVQKAQREVLRAHLEDCVQQAFQSGNEKERAQKLDEIMKLIGK